MSNSLTEGGLEGVTVSIDPVGVELATAADGSYEAEELPVGVYVLTYEKQHFETQTKQISLVAGATVTADVALEPDARVILDVDVSGEAAPGNTLTATVTAIVLDGSTVDTVAWSQTGGVEVVIGSANQPSTSVDLPDEAAYKAELIHVVSEPPIGEEDLPPNVELPEGEFPGGLQNRFQIVGLNPFSLEEAALVALDVEVTTSSGTYAEEVEIHAELPWKTAAGINNVPLDRAVLLQGKDLGEGATYDWALDAPDGSAATLADETSQNPYFTPDVEGEYTVTVTDTTQDPAETVTLEIYAGRFEGVIAGQDENGRPLASDACTVCHQEDGVAPDVFTPWKETGHAEIFTVSLNTNTHYSTGCLACHTVGYDPEDENGGMDDAAGYDAFLAAFTTDGVNFVANPNNWDDLLAGNGAGEEFEDVAKLSNIQCENCHGPQNTPAHPQSEDATVGSARATLSSDICAVCHGEPLRHARFQQWQLSPHANYELAIEEGESGNCSRCHTGNGFLTWVPILLDDDPETDPLEDIEVTWTADQAHPQTCVACHDPHMIGTTSGNVTDATVRISGDTPPLIAGFQVFGVGNGAICMTCHNTRRGLRNDDTWDDTVADEDTARAPHPGAQTDLLVGQNAYFVNVGVRGPHSLVADTCVNCHMVQTPPPDILSYNFGGANHTFYASETICSACHGEAFDAEGVEAATEATLDQLQTLVEDAILSVIAEQTGAGNTIDLDGEAEITDVADVADIEFGETHGRQAITVTFTDETVVGPMRVTDIEVKDGGGAVLGELYDFADERVPKAGWNWNLVHSDGSGGIHNPTFATTVLDAAIDQLNRLAREEAMP